jgi:hypothetical protein
MRDLRTVSASTMIAQVDRRRKVRCHTRAVDFAGCIAKSLTSLSIAAHPSTSSGQALPKIAEGGASSVMVAGKDGPAPGLYFWRDVASFTAGLRRGRRFPGC